MFVASAIVFLTGGVLVIRADPPPSGTPVLGMLTHGLWALAIALLAIGAVTRSRPPRSLPERLATGALGLGVVVGLQWVTWAYVDVRAARSEGYEIVLETVITPFGAGHVLMYGILLGAGVAFLGWEFVGSRRDQGLHGWGGIAVGSLTVLAATLSLLAVLEGGGDGHWLFDVATLLLAVCYLWAMGVGIGFYRRSRGRRADRFGG